MIIVTAVIYPGGNAAESYEVLHGTVTNTRADDANGDSYAAHFLQRPHAQEGLEGFEADVAVDGFHRPLGLTPLLGSIFYAIAPLPLDFEPQVRVDARLTLKELDEFDARLRGRR